MRRLRDVLAVTDADPVAIDASGALVRDELPESLGPATLLVGPVVDALKLVDDDRVVASGDRDQFWAVHGLVLSRELLEQIGDTEMGLPAVIEAVERAGHGWDAHQWRGSARA